MKTFGKMIALATGLALAGSAWPALPPPNPAQARAAAAKKAEADAKAAKEKEVLAASMDRISGRWKERAAEEGWQIRPPPDLPPPPRITPGVTPANAGVPAPAPAGAVPGTAAASSATAAAPLSVQALNSAKVPIRSEKLGTAPASEDVKAGPTRTLPAGAAPTVNKKGVPENAPKQ